MARARDFVIGLRAVVTNRGREAARFGNVRRVQERITSGRLLRAWSVGELAVTETRHEGGTVLAPHAHRVASMVLVAEGRYEEDVDGETVELSTTTILYKPAGVTHANRFPHGAVTSLVVELPKALLPDRMLHLNAIDVARCLRAELREQAPGWQLIAQGLLLECVGRLRRCDAGEPASWLSDLEQLLRTGAVDSLSAAARRLGRDPSHLAKAFRRRYGCSVGDYVRRLRIDAICRDLATTDKPLASIALEAGFYDQSHFTRVFAGAVRMTPGQFRRRHRSGGARGLP